MPYSLKKIGKSWQVINTETGEIHSKGTTKAKAEAQIHLLQGVDHGWKPTGRGGISVGEQPLIEKLRIHENPTTAVPHGQPHTIGFGGIGGPYDRFLSSRHPAFKPKNKGPLFPQQ
jgi:hypothetical protein